MATQETPQNANPTPFPPPGVGQGSANIVTIRVMFPVKDADEGLNVLRTVEATVDGIPGATVDMNYRTLKR